MSSNSALWLADVHLLAGALLAIVLGAMAALRQPAQRMAIAKSALAGLAALVVLCALPGWSLVHLLSAEAPPVVVAVEPVTVEPLVREPLAPLPTRAPEFAMAPAVESTPPVAAAPPAPIPAAPIDWVATALLVHALGSTVVVAWLALGAVLARRVRETSRPASAELAQALGAVVESSRAPELLTSSEVDMPVALGLRRPAIILPECAGAQRNLTAVLAHEWAHIAAGDLRTLAATRWLLVILWPQPLFWLLRRVIRLDQETLADAAAAEVAGRIDYAEQLLGWARSSGPRAPRLAGAVGLWESPSQLKRRIATLLDEKLTVLRAASRRWRIGTACAALVAACLLSLVTLQRQDAAAQDAAAELAAETETAAPAVAAEPVAESAAETDASPAAAPVAAPAAVPETRAEPDWASYEANVVNGRTLDEAGKPLAGVEVVLYRYEFAGDGAEAQQVAVQTSGADGSFRFQNVIDVATEFPNGIPGEYFNEGPFPAIAVLGRAAGRATAWGNSAARSVATRGHVDQLTLKPAATLRGRVRGPDGRGVAGAKVTAGYGMPPGVDIYSTETDAEGRYEIADLAAFDAEKTRRELAEMAAKQGANSFITMSTVAGSNPLMVRHPDFAARRVEIKTIPGELNVELQPGAVIKGMAVTREPDGTIAPAANAVLQVTRVLPEPKPGEAPAAYPYQTTPTRTDAEGRYRFDSLPEGRYTLSGQLKGWVTQGVENMAAPAGETSEAPDLVFTRGGTVRIKLVDADSGQPLSLLPGTRGYVNPRRRPELPLGIWPLQPNFATFDDSTAEVRIAAGDYTFLVHIPGAAPLDPFWQSTNYESSQTDATYAAREGETVEATVPMKRFEKPQMASATFSSATAAASDEESGEEPNAYEIPETEPTNDFVPATAPADNLVPATQGATTRRTSGGILGQLDPTPVTPGEPLWTLRATTAADEPATTLAATIPESGDGAFDPNAPAGVIFKRADGSEVVAAAVGELGTVRRGVVMGDTALDEGTETTHTTTGVGEIAAVAIGVPAEAAIEGANTISVRCLDEKGAPLEGVDATLYRMWYRDGIHERVTAVTSDATGEAKFSDVVPATRVAEYNAMLAARQHDGLFTTNVLIVTRRAGRATAMFGAGEYEVVRRGYAADVTLGPAQKLTGRVTSPDGKPVAGAVVAAGSMANVTIEGANAVRTDADGRYEFNDRPNFDAAAAREQMPKTNFLSFVSADEAAAAPPVERQTVRADLWASQVTVSHPDFAVTQASGGDIPGTVDVRMQPAASIIGRVTMSGSGAPATDMLVRAYGHSDMEIGDDGSIKRRTGDLTLTRASGHAAATRTDAEGAYRLSGMPEGVYDVWVQTTTNEAARSELTNTGISELPVRAGSEPAVAPDLVVGPGGLLRVQIVDAVTGEPLRLPGGARATVIPNYVGGPRMQDRHSAEAIVSADGKVEARIAPGKAHLSLHVESLDAAPDGGLRPAFMTADSSYADGTAVDVAHGDEVDVTIPVWPRAAIETRRAATTEAYKPFQAEKWAEAVEAFTAHFEQYPDDTGALLGRAMSYDKLKQFDKAAADYERVLEMDPDEINTLIRLSALLATANDAAVRDGARAVELAQRLVVRAREEGYREMIPETLATLAAAYAEAGDFEKAVATQRDVVAQTSDEKRSAMEERLKLYEAGTAYRRE